MRGIIYPTSLLFKEATNLLDVFVVVDVRISDNHIISSDIAQNTLEDGSKISDHIVMHPRQLTVVFSQVNSFEGSSRAKNVWQTLLYAWKKRELLTVATEHETYENMAIQSITALHTEPFKGALQFSMSLLQINSVSLSYVPVPASLLEQDAQSTNKTAASPIKGGTVQARELVFAKDSKTQLVYKE